MAAAEKPKQTTNSEMSELIGRTRSPRNIPPNMQARITRKRFNTRFRAAQNSQFCCFNFFSPRSVAAAGCADQTQLTAFIIDVVQFCALDVVVGILNVSHVVLVGVHLEVPPCHLGTLIERLNQ